MAMISFSEISRSFFGTHFFFSLDSDYNQILSNEKTKFSSVKGQKKSDSITKFWRNAESQGFWINTLHFPSLFKNAKFEMSKEGYGDMKLTVDSALLLQQVVSSVLRSTNAKLHSGRVGLLIIVLNPDQMYLLPNFMMYANTQYCGMYGTPKFLDAAMPICAFTHHISRISISTIMNNLGTLNCSGFSRYVANGNSRTGSYSNAMRFNIMSYFVTQRDCKAIVNIGVHPIAPVYATRLGVPIVQLEISPKPNKDTALLKRICDPNTAKSVKMAPRPPTPYVPANDKEKLENLFSIAYQNNDVIIYIGAFPAVFPINSMKSHRGEEKLVLLIDPAFEKSELVENTNACYTIKWAWDWSNDQIHSQLVSIPFIKDRILDQVVDAMDDACMQNAGITIIDDTWVDDPIEMNAMFMGKLRTAATFSKERMYFRHRDTLWIKFNYYSKIVACRHDYIDITNLIELKYFPGMNDSIETRLIFKAACNRNTVSRIFWYNYVVELRRITVNSNRYRKDLELSLLSSYLPIEWNFDGFKLANSVSYLSKVTPNGFSFDKCVVLALWSISNIGNAPNASEWINKVNTFARELTNMDMEAVITVPSYERASTYVLEYPRSRELVKTNTNKIFRFYDKYVDYTITNDDLMNINNTMEFSDYMFTNYAMGGSKALFSTTDSPPQILGYSVPYVGLDINDKIDANRLNQVTRFLYVSSRFCKILDTLIVQSVADSFGFRLKALSVLMRSHRLMDLNETYRTRASLLLDMVDNCDGGLLLNSRTNRILCTKTRVYKFHPGYPNMPTFTWRLVEGSEYELSGHLLNICIISNFIQAPVDVWVSQMYTNANVVYHKENYPENSNDHMYMVTDAYYEVLQKLGMVETQSDDVFKFWHTVEEMIMTCAILPKYATMMLSRMNMLYEDAHERMLAVGEMLHDKFSKPLWDASIMAQSL